MIQVEIDANGGLAMLHDDAVDLGAFGDVTVERASHVEFCNRKQRWYVQSAKTDEYLKEDFLTRAEALAWEKAYFSPTGQGWAELNRGK